MENFISYNNQEIDYNNYLVKEALKKRYVLDASVVSKWHYDKNEDDLNNATIIYNILNSDKHIFFAPDLIVYELLNIYRTKLELDDEKIDEILSEIYDSIVILGINKNTFSKAFKTARELNISLYDSIYLSLSEDLNAQLITADKKLFRAVKPNKMIIMLSNFLQ